MNVPMPDGQIVSFPDDMPKEQIKALIAKKYPSDAAAHLRDTATAIESGQYTGTILPFRKDASGIHMAVPTAVQSLIDLPERLMTASGSAPAGSRELTQNLIAPAAETAMAAGPMDAMGVAARKAAIPSQEQLFSAADKGYQAIGDLGVRIKKSAVVSQADSITKDLVDDNFRDYLHPKTFRAVQELKTPAGKEATVSDIDGVRKLLGRVAKDPNETAAATTAIKKIDSYLNSIPEGDFVSGTSEEVSKLLKETRGNYAAGKRSELLTRSQEKAEQNAASSGSGANLANTIRQRAKFILDPFHPERAKGFTEEEKQQLDSIIRGTKVSNAARLISKLSLYHPITGWGPAIAAEVAGTASGIPGAGLMTLAAGSAAHHLSIAIPEKQLRILDEMVRTRSPLGASELEKAAKGLTAVKKKAFYEAATRALGSMSALRKPPITISAPAGSEPQ